MRNYLGDEIVEDLTFLVVVLTLVLGTHRFSDGNVNNVFSIVTNQPRPTLVSTANFFRSVQTDSASLHRHFLSSGARWPWLTGLLAILNRCGWPSQWFPSIASSRMRRS